jgi:hypothetical protein
MMFIVQIRHRHLVHQMSSQDLNFLLRGVVFPLSLGHVFLHLGYASSNAGKLHLRQSQDNFGPRESLCLPVEFVSSLALYAV